MKWTVAKRARDKWPQHLAAFDEIATGPLDLTKSFPGAFESLGKLFHSAPATKSLKPRPALWIPTLAMKLQKPCPERRPLTAPSLQPRALPTQPASERLTACCKPLRPTQQTLGSAAAAFKRGTFLQLLAMKLLRPAPQLWPNARLKTLQPSALAVASRAERPRNLANARLPQCAVKLWAQAVAAVTFKLQRLACVGDEIAAALARTIPRPCSRQRIATASRQPPSPAQASSARVSL